MKKTVIVVACWMALLLGLGLWLHGSSSKKPTSSKVAIPERTDTSAKPLVLPPSQPVVPQQQGVASQAPAIASSGAADQQRLLLATSGWPALAKMPWHEGGVSADYAGYDHGQVVLVVKYGNDAAKARRLLAAFLQANHDFLSHYSLRYVSAAVSSQQQQVLKVGQLANKGDNALPFLPLRRGRTSIFLTGLAAHPALRVDYTGSLAQAKREVKAMLSDLNDVPSHYRISYHKGGPKAAKVLPPNPDAEPNYKPTLPPRLRKK